MMTNRSSLSVLARRIALLLLITAVWLGAVEIRFENNRAISTRDLIDNLSLPKEFEQLPINRQEYFFEISSFYLKQLYENRGYFGAKVNCYPIHKDGSVYWSCLVDEGERWSFGGFSYILADTALLEQLPPTKIRPGTPFNNKDLSNEVERIADALRSIGFLNLRRDYRLLPDTVEHKIDVEVALEPGAQVLMGDLEISTQRISTPSSELGAAGLTSHEYLKELWQLEPGMVVNGREYLLFRQKLLQTGLFRQVKLQDSLRSDQLSDIHLLTVEKQPGAWSNRIFWEPLYLGAGLETEVRYRNFLGRFHEGSVGALMAENRQRLTLGYAHPLPFGIIFRFDDRLSYNQEEMPIINYPDSLEKRFEFRNRSTISRNFSPHIRGLFGADIRRITLFAGQKNSPDSLTRAAYNKLNLEPVLDLQYTDDWLEPTKGWRSKISLVNGGRFDQRFNSIKIENSLYFPFNRLLYWALAFDAGIFLQPGDGDDAKTFYQGGFRSVRGYAERSIFPQKTTTELNSSGEEIEVIHPGLAPRFLRVSNELRFNMSKAIKNVQLVQFTDWARVIDSDRSFGDGEEMGVGVGIRYRFPFLTLRLDYTLKKTFRDLLELEGFSWSRFSFDLSQAI